MMEKNRRRILLSLKLVIISALLLFISIELALSDEVDTATDSKGENITELDKERAALPIVYIHGGIGIGTDWLSSSSIENDAFASGPEIRPWGLLNVSYHIRGGFNNVLQVEYTINVLGPDHPIRDDSGPVDVDIDMKFKYEDFLFKINPFFKNYNNAKESAVFFVFGRGGVKYLDKKGDGWKGNSTIYGIEKVYIEKKFSTCIGLKVKNINFTKGTMPVLTGKNKYSATSILIECSVAFGVGK